MWSCEGLVGQGAWTVERYIMAAETYGPSGQLIFDGCNELLVCTRISGDHPEAVLGWHSGHASDLSKIGPLYILTITNKLR